MRALEAIEQDVIQVLSKIDELKRDARKDLLMALFQKHIVLNEADLVLIKHDFDVITSIAKLNYSKEPMPIQIGDKMFLPQEATNLMLVEATIEVLNSKGALKRLPKFTRR